jgi:hypothetical protein
MRPSDSFFWNLYPASSMRWHAACRLSTLMHVWPKPRCGSTLPLLTLYSASSSVP